MSIVQSIKSIFDKQNIPTGVVGETYKGILICETNRVSGFVVNDQDKMRTLKLILQKNYIDNGLKAVIFGVHAYDEEKEFIKYAIYCSPTKAKELLGFERRIPSIFSYQQEPIAA